jgi:hypothetical protein
MEFDSGFVSTVITALGIGGGGGAWLHKWFTDKRNALPLPRADWEDHPEGWSVTIELINRLNEDIFVERVDAKAAFFVPPPRDNGSSVSRRESSIGPYRDGAFCPVSEWTVAKFAA